MASAQSLWKEGVISDYPLVRHVLPISRTAILICEANAQVDLHGVLCLIYNFSTYRTCVGIQALQRGTGWEVFDCRRMSV